MTEGVERRFVACDRRVDNGGVFVRRGVESRRMVLMGFGGSDGVEGDGSASADSEATSGCATVSSIVHSVLRKWLYSTGALSQASRNFLK